ncbi:MULTISPECIES: hypothetical protein [unclassified Pseudoalteromonas]|uniref:hypothetical protein n=1 Tax=unclassified Pseudoalteromonas TaxID=194690 RepID=UPI000CF6D61E|nr:MULTISPECIES: hypothetical protein [unclassified Pseudoalteromonas]MBS3798208.1 hypothetical protein [Pseudoalteromonas sp. BDTF-M6]
MSTNSITLASFFFNLLSEKIKKNHFRAKAFFICPHLYAQHYTKNDKRGKRFMLLMCQLPIIQPKRAFNLSHIYNNGQRPKVKMESVAFVITLCYTVADFV